VTDASEQSLDERYGRSRRRGIDRRLGWSFAVLLVLLGLVVVVFGNWHTTSSTEAKVKHYVVQDDRTVTLDYTVTAPAGSLVVCALEALSESFSTVGWKVIEFPASERITREFNESLLTTYRATTATVHSCWISAAA